MAVLRSAPSAADLAGRATAPATACRTSEIRSIDYVRGTLRQIHAGPAATGLIAQVLLIAVLAATVGLGAAGWVVGVACAVTIAAALARGLARGLGNRLEPA